MHRLLRPGLFALAAVLACGGCHGLSLEGDDDPGATEAFGAPYRIIVADAPGLGVRAPRLDGDTLRAFVTYGGGCKEHRFVATFSVGRDASGAPAALAAFEHRTPGDPCEAMLTHEVKARVPAAFRDAPRRALRLPRGGTFAL